MNDADKFEKEIVFGSSENCDEWLSQFDKDAFAQGTFFYLESDSWAQKLWRRIRWSRAVHLPVTRIQGAWFKLKLRMGWVKWD